MIFFGDLGLPIWLDDHSLMRLDDQRRSCDQVPRLKRVPQEHGSIVPRSTREHRRCGLWLWQLVGRQRQVRLLRKVPATKRLNFDCLDLDRLVLADESEALQVHRLKRALESSGRAKWHWQRAVGAEIAQMRLNADANTGARNALTGELHGDLDETVGDLGRLAAIPDLGG